MRLWKPAKRSAILKLVSIVVLWLLHINSTARVIWTGSVKYFLMYIKEKQGMSSLVCVSVCISVDGVRLTAVILESSLQVLSRPLCSKSLCWMTLCIVAGSSEPISISWLADSSAVSRVCCQTHNGIRHKDKKTKQNAHSGKLADKQDVSGCCTSSRGEKFTK